MGPYLSVTQASLPIPETTRGCYVLAETPGKTLLSFWRDQAGLGYTTTQAFGHIRIALVVVLWFCIYSLPNYRHGTQPQTWLVYLCFDCTNTYK